jgi:predicted MPP superfamily phosphohydrolase
LGGLKAALGVFGVPGNHDNFSGQSGWIGIFDEMGIRILMNENVAMVRGGSALVLTGVTDIRRGEPPPDVVAALLGAEEGSMKILMSHQPGGAMENAKAGISLQLSGHTHGGQILGLHLIAKFANRGFISGLYDVEGMKLYVGNGAGLWTGFPVRLGVPSEIAKIVLVPGEQ